MVNGQETRQPSCDQLFRSQIFIKRLLKFQHSHPIIFNRPYFNISECIKHFLSNVYVIILCWITNYTWTLIHRLCPLFLPNDSFTRFAPFATLELIPHIYNFQFSSKLGCLHPSIPSSFLDVLAPTVKWPSSNGL